MSEYNKVSEAGMCPHGNFPDSCEQCLESAKPMGNLDDLSQHAIETKGMVLFHGGLEDKATLDDIDLARPGSQQNKKKRTYGGFYLSDESSRTWAEDYAKKTNRKHTWFSH